MSTPGWLSAAVEKIWLWRLGMVVLRGIIGVARPPSASGARRRAARTARARLHAAGFRGPVRYHAVPPPGPSLVAHVAERLPPPVDAEIMMRA